MTTRCPTCEKDFKAIGRHWHNSKSHAPKIRGELAEIITGVVMGDGHIFKNGKNARLEINNTNKEYLKYLQKRLGVLASGISLKRTAEESMNEQKKRGIASKYDINNYSDIYHLRTSTHHELNKWHDWYSGSSKKWPENITLTPTVLKHWYVCDGHYDTAQHHDRIKIAMANEIENTDKVDSYFVSAGLPEPSNYNISERQKSEGFSCVAVFSRQASAKIFEYMGEPVQGFEYKWPSN